MFSRRRLIASGILGSVASAFSTAEAEPTPGTSQGSRTAREVLDADGERVAAALDRLRDELRGEREFSEIGPLRDAQKLFLRQNGKMPDFIDVGSDLWFTAYDWHVRWRQPITISRDAMGRTTLALLQTALVLRPDSAANFMSLPYDAR
jgi:hypothetical protein